MASRKLNPRQRLFALEYLVDLNAADAARRAGYSAASAETNGPRLLRNAQVRAFVEQQLRKQTRKLELTAELVLEQLAHLVRFDPTDLFDPETGKLLGIHEMPERARRCLVAFEEEALFDQVEVGGGPRGGVQKERVQVGVTRKLKWVSKAEAVKLGMQRFGLLAQDDDGQKPVKVQISINGIQQGAQ